MTDKKAPQADAAKAADKVRAERAAEVPPPKSPLVEALRKKLTEEKERLEKEIAPYREYHDKHVNDAKYLEARKRIKEINAELGPVCNELAALARSTGARGMRVEPGQYSKKEQ